MSFGTIAIWLVLILNISVSYLVFKKCTLGTFRTAAYMLILFTAFIFDLSGLSFSNLYLFSVFTMVVLFVLSELFWYLHKKLTNLKVKIVFTIVGLSAFVVFVIPWAGAFSIPHATFPQTAVKYYEVENSEFVVRQRLRRNLFDLSHHFTLRRSIPFLPLEKKLDSYSSPEGYFDSVYKFLGTESSEGVHIIIVADEDTLWTVRENPTY
ncbi:hypothetical protein QA601_07150 [Chitinispirillales bacterium ANBcel5]|uniref:hypothetical protein n=1 Tax=Cellulosispirillum alkaliphilum TaxID=3039283 RepID=UPI002A51B5E0|nr:hypothetical protein [Chitinispirillales bacterium ANBcel5]